MCINFVWIMKRKLREEFSYLKQLERSASQGSKQKSVEDNGGSSLLDLGSCQKLNDLNPGNWLSQEVEKVVNVHELCMDHEKKTQRNWLSQEVEKVVNVHELCMDHEKKTQSYLKQLERSASQGSKQKTVEDNWCSRACALESCKNIDVASKLSQNSLAFTFRREPRGGVEQDQFDSLKAMVEGISLVNIRDRWIWSLKNSGDFTVASIRKLIDDSHHRRSLLAHVGSKRCLLRMDIDSIICPTCGKAVESIKHIFFTCQIARDILHLITSWWSILYMEVSSYEEWVLKARHGGAKATPRHETPRLRYEIDQGVDSRRCMSRSVKRRAKA
nr:hypothetical protein [Tanacetum cinerariifolium]